MAHYGQPQPPHNGGAAVPPLGGQQFSYGGVTQTGYQQHVAQNGYYNTMPGYNLNQLGLNAGYGGYGVPMPATNQLQGTGYMGVPMYQPSYGMPQQNGVYMSSNMQPMTPSVTMMPAMAPAPTPSQQAPADDFGDFEGSNGASDLSFGSSPPKAKLAPVVNPLTTGAALPANLFRLPEGKEKEPASAPSSLFESLSRTINSKETPAPAPAPVVLPTLASLKFSAPTPAPNAATAPHLQHGPSSATNYGEHASVDSNAFVPSSSASGHRTPVQDGDFFAAGAPIPPMIGTNTAQGFNVGTMPMMTPDNTGFGVFGGVARLPEISPVALAPGTTILSTGAAHVATTPADDFGEWDNSDATATKGDEDDFFAAAPSNSGTPTSTNGSMGLPNMFEMGTSAHTSTPPIPSTSTQLPLFPGMAGPMPLAPGGAQPLDMLPTAEPTSDGRSGSSSFGVPGLQPIAPQPTSSTLLASAAPKVPVVPKKVDWSAVSGSGLFSTSRPADPVIGLPAEEPSHTHAAVLPGSTPGSATGTPTSTNNTNTTSSNDFSFPADTSHVPPPRGDDDWGDFDSAPAQEDGSGFVIAVDSGASSTGIPQPTSAPALALPPSFSIPLSRETPPLPADANTVDIWGSLSSSTSFGISSPSTPQPGIVDLASSGGLDFLLSSSSGSDSAAPAMNFPIGDLSSMFSSSTPASSSASMEIHITPMVPEGATSSSNGPPVAAWSDDDLFSAFSGKPTPSQPAPAPKATNPTPLGPIKIPKSMQAPASSPAKIAAASLAAPPSPTPKRTSSPVPAKDVKTVPVQFTPQGVLRWQQALEKCIAELSSGTTYFSTFIKPKLARVPAADRDMVVNSLFISDVVRNYVVALSYIFRIVERIEDVFFQDPLQFSKLADPTLPSISVLLSQSHSNWKDLKKAMTELSPRSSFVREVCETRHPETDTDSTDRCAVCGKGVAAQEKVEWGGFPFHLQCANFWANRVMTPAAK